MDAKSFMGLIYSSLNRLEDSAEFRGKAYEISLKLGDAWNIYRSAFEFISILLKVNRIDEAIKTGEDVIDTIVPPTSNVVIPFYLAIGNAYYLDENSEKVSQIAEKLLFASNKKMSKTRCIKLIQDFY